MTGEYLAELMSNNELKGILAKHARRYSKRVENQEEYIQDAWIRIADEPDGRTIEHYGEQGRKAIKASYDRYWYSVRKKTIANPNGISVTGKEIKKKAKLPRSAIHLYRDKHLDTKPQTLDWQYYEGQEDEMRADVVASDMWYNKYPNFDSLPKHERERVISQYMNRGYSVGMPIGATPGKESKRYKVIIDYRVDGSGVVEPTHVPVKHPLAHEWRMPAGGPASVFDLSEWYRLRAMGGSNKWLQWLDKTISELEQRG
jgi:hypothetical protein